MENLNELKVLNAEAAVEYGVFYIEFEGGEVLQCSLALLDNKYVERIDVDCSGYNYGVNLKVNRWAKRKDGSMEHIKLFLIEQAQVAGVEVVV